MDTATLGLIQDMKSSGGFSMKDLLELREKAAAAAALAATSVMAARARETDDTALEITDRNGDRDSPSEVDVETEEEKQNDDKDTFLKVDDDEEKQAIVASPFFGATGENPYSKWFQSNEYFRRNGECIYIFLLCWWGIVTIWVTNSTLFFFVIVITHHRIYSTVEFIF